jgi:hypothetical protein
MLMAMGAHAPGALLIGPAPHELKRRIVVILVENVEANTVKP